jgi:hypothetical protein
MSTTPTTPALMMAVQQAFDVTYVTKALPPQFTIGPNAIFFTEMQDGALIYYDALENDPGERLIRVANLIKAGLGGVMIGEICNLGWSPYVVFSGWSQQGVDNGYPPYVLNGVVQKQLGVPGQIGMPNDYEPGVNTAPYPALPAPMPAGWQKIPPIYQKGVNVLLAPGADYQAIIDSWFGVKA